jgi:hypothetical protein
LDCGKVGFSEGGWDSWRLVAIKRFKGGVESIGMLARVVSKFYEGEQFGPGFRINGTEDRQIGLNLLVDSFGCPIGFGVERGGWRALDSHQSESFLEAIGHETGISVRDDFVGSSESSQEMTEDEISYSLSQESLGAWDEDDPLGEAVINDNQDGVKPF